MNKKNLSLVVLLFVIMIGVTGCSEKEERSATKVSGSTIKQTIVEEDFDEKGTGVLKCTTDANAAEGIDVDLSYMISYKRGNILELISTQRVTSSESKNLDLYEDAYNNIAKNYIGLKYYDTSVVRDSNTVTYKIVINYDKIDIDALLDIEGEEDNVIEGGKAKLSLWLDLAGKMGTVCEEV